MLYLVIWKVGNQMDTQEIVTTELDLDNISGSEILLEMLEKAIKLPGIKVNRNSFIMDSYNINISEINDPLLFSNISLEQMDKVANGIIKKNVSASSITAFGLGFPGGFTMVASIPADVLQNFAFSLRLAQQIAYAYGFDDIFVEDQLTKESKTILVLFLGIMFMANGSGAILRAISPNVGKYVGTQVAAKPLMKTVWYPALKKIVPVITGKTLTKPALKGFITKSIPVIGGITSAGINVATMVPMANRLKAELRTFHLPENEVVEIIEKDKKSISEISTEIFNAASISTGKMVENTKAMGPKIVTFAKGVATKSNEKVRKSKDVK